MKIILHRRLLNDPTLYLKMNGNLTRLLLNDPILYLKMKIILQDYYLMTLPYI